MMESILNLSNDQWWHLLQRKKNVKFLTLYRHSQLGGRKVTEIQLEQAGLQLNIA